MEANNNKLIVVLGMHRSGTSVITRGLKVLGVHLGNNIMPAGEDNPMGYWEDEDITTLNVEILNFLKSDWHFLTPIQSEDVNTLHRKGYFLRAVEMLRKKMAEAPIFGFKDPRVTKLLPFWEKVIAHCQFKTHYILAIRHPLSVCKSLATRNGFEIGKSYLLWLEHVINSFAGIEGESCVVVDYDRLLQSPETELMQVAKEFQLQIDHQELEKFKLDFLDNELRHTVYQLKDLTLDEAAPPLVMEVYAKVLEIAANGYRKEDVTLKNCIKQWSQELSRLKSTLVFADKLESRIAEREQSIQALTALMAEKEQALTAQAVEKEQAEEALTVLLEEKEQAVQTLTAQIAEKEESAQVLAILVAEKEQAVQTLTAQIAEKEESAQGLAILVAEREQAVQTLTAQMVEKEKSVQALATQAAYVSTQLNEREQVSQALNARLWEIYGSHAWRIIQLLWKIRLVLIPPNSLRSRVARQFYNRVRQFYNLVTSTKSVVEQNHKIQNDVDMISSSSLFDRDWYISTYPDVAQAKVDPAHHYLFYGGFEGKDPGPNFSSKWYFDMYPDVFASELNPLVHYIKYGQQDGRFPTMDARLVIEPEYRRVHAFQIVPYYLDPNATTEIIPIQSRPKIAVHFHLHYREMLDQCANYLNNIPFSFDLYVSATDKNDPDEIAIFLQKHIRLLNNIVVKKTPNRGRDLAPLIVDFRKDLLNYDFVAHFHTKKSPHNLYLQGWFEDIMDSLLGSQSGIHQIFNLLSGDAKFVYPAPNRKILTNENGWGDNYDLAKDLLPKLLGEKIEAYPIVEFPQGSMFWAKPSALSKFLGLPLTYTDFPAEPVPADGTILHILERLLLISANHLPGRNYRIYLSRSITKEPYYESQKDYSHSQVHNSVKVLSYYLPQFYPTPENDEWHGKGFTEWTKVQSANPLFYGHYQQRVPHEDIGYYSLTSAEMLKKQVELMKWSGVYGQIFYHYWFTGKLILENPAQMLLADKSIEMPFCFCWANENWTRKWDGNEDEILLGQTYSEQDAIQFINYLIPFFKDDRYIKIEGRPVLYIYRPSSIPDFEIYKKAWEKVCAENSIKTPFIVAVLTRGAKSPADFGMDAGCERVLHDWTNGNVKEIKNYLSPYRPINGKVLNYDEVADYYMNQSPNTDFTYFRSLIPSWDNTPRYGSEAYIVHKSTPEKFQKWLEMLIADAEERLPDDLQFVVVNAWNEWAESAVLEPDSRFGYAYLNSIGRALSGSSFDDREYLHQVIPEATQISISFNENLLKELQIDKNLREKMLSCVANSTVFSLCNVFFEQSQVAHWMSIFSGTFNQNEENLKLNYVVHIKDICYFAPDVIENMLKMALCYDAGLITPSHINDPKFTHQFLSDRWESGKWISPYMFLLKNGDKRSIKCCVDAGIFISSSQSLQKSLKQKVSTIIRFSQSGNMKLLQNALYSLMAQIGCIVQPIIAVQDLTDGMLADLDAMLEKMPWDDDCCPIIRKYHSTENNHDLRSLMLNDSLKAVKTKYATILDYDDIVFHDAYAWLIDRLQKTAKNASFGLVYSTVFNLAENRIKMRKVVYDYGRDYKSFLSRNHSPIHGIMFNMSKINLDQIEYHEDMKYMEDYYLTLQILTEDDTDWESLQERRFIGDYYHHEDKVQTLAVLDQEQRNKIVSMPDYAKCENRINEMRNRLR